MQVAQTILEQLGGGRFLAMTGAKNLVGDARSLRFQLPRGLVQGVSHVVVELQANDLYTVRGILMHNLKLRTVFERGDLYADQLRAYFTAETGLETSLGTMEGAR